MAVTRSRNKATTAGSQGPTARHRKPASSSKPKVTGKATRVNSTSTPPAEGTVNPSLPAKPAPTDLPTHAFATAADFETFLDREHQTCPGLYIKYARKNSGIPSITAAQAVEVALCFGFIDGVSGAIDDTYWRGRFTPRRPKSIWSQKNVETVGRLIEEGRMRDAGMKAVQAAKDDGRWERAYAGPARMAVPGDLKVELEGWPVAKAFFEMLNRSRRYAVLFRVETGSVATREERVQAVVQMLAAGQVPGEKCRAGTGGRNRRAKVSKDKNVA